MTQTISHDLMFYVAQATDFVSQQQIAAHVYSSSVTVLAL